MLKKLAAEMKEVHSYTILAMITVAEQSDTMNRVIRIKCLLILALIFSAHSHAAGIKKWEDESGQVNYGDSPPANVESKAVRVTRPPSNPGKALPRFSGSQGEQPQSPDQQAQVPAAPEEPDVPQEQAAQLCEEAKSDLVKLNRSDNIRVRSKDGSVRYMSAQEREERRKLTEEDIEQFCK